MTAICMSTLTRNTVCRQPKAVYTEEMTALAKEVPGFAPLTYRRTLEETDSFSEAISVLEIRKQATRSA